MAEIEKRSERGIKPRPPLLGPFSNLPPGAILTVNGKNLQGSYTGGDGNDLTLTIVP